MGASKYAPSCRIDADEIAPDSAKIVLTLRWDAEDIDGNETIIEAEIRLNNGPWAPVTGSRAGLPKYERYFCSRLSNGFLVDTALYGAAAVVPIEFSFGERLGRFDSE